MKRSGFLKRKTPLKQVSDKRAEENIEYRLALAEWKLKRISQDGFLRCQFTGDPHNPEVGADDTGRCWADAVDCHHRKGRGKYLTFTQFFFAVCRFHHTWIHEHANEARKRKLLLT